MDRILLRSLADEGVDHEYDVACNTTHGKFLKIWKPSHDDPKAIQRSYFSFHLNKHRSVIG